jgi:hypothetical protein
MRGTPAGTGIMPDFIFAVARTKFYNFPYMNIKIIDSEQAF